MINFDIDTDELKLIGDELAATPRQIQMSFSRALNRTAATLRRMSSRGLQSELQLRNATEIRRRLKQLRVKRTRDMTEIRLWYGKNDMRLSSFKGRAVADSKGASFIGGPNGRQEFTGGFIAKSKSGRRTIFKRKGKSPLPIVEQKMPVSEKMQLFLEDKIFADIEDIFFKHFRADLAARTRLGVGRQ